MTVQHFLTKIEGYFGKEYDKVPSDTLEQWLTRKVPEKDLPSLYAEVVRTISTRYKTLPGVKELSECWRDVRSRKTTEHDWRQYICPHCLRALYNDGELRKSSYRCSVCNRDVAAREWVEVSVTATFAEIQKAVAEATGQRVSM